MTNCHNWLVARADADRQVHQAQALWSACSALWSTLNSADFKQSWQKQLRPLKNEVEAVRKASGKSMFTTVQFSSVQFTLSSRIWNWIVNAFSFVICVEKDELVNVILDTLPEKAKARGVYPENAIRERFLKVERLARQLALVPEKDASIVTYVLSYLQSVLIIQPKELISQAELNNEPIDISKLSTFEILDRTR